MGNKRSTAGKNAATPPAAAAAVAAPAVAAPEAPAVAAPEAPQLDAQISHEDAAHLVDIEVEDVFAVNEFSDRYHVITTDGQKLVAMKE